jgi:hypothetical protein
VLQVMNDYRGFTSRGFRPVAILVPTTIFEYPMVCERCRVGGGRMGRGDCQVFAADVRDRESIKAIAQRWRKMTPDYPP